MAASQTAFLKERPYLAVSITHFFVDVLNSSRNLLVAIIAVSLGLTNAQVGIVLLLYNVGSALSQPLFGWLADRIGARLLVIGGMGWMIFFFSLASVTGDWVALIALTIASVGSGAFHPTGTMVASRTSQQHQNRATAVFFMAGQLGLFIGPVATGILLEGYGRPGYLVLPALSVMAIVSGWQWIRSNHHQVIEEATVKTVAVNTAIIKQPVDTHLESRPSRPTLRAILLALIILSSGTVSIAAITFVPKLFTELNYDSAYVGWLSGLIMIGSAIGGVVGGTLADRIPGRSVILLGMIGAILPVYFYIPAGGMLRFALLFTAGFFVGMPHTILVLMVQSLLPNRRAMASGLALGFMFFSGALGSYILGIVADRVGLATALQGTAVLPAIVILVTILLPRQASAKFKG